jgi:hypothetical protein
MQKSPATPSTTSPTITVNMSALKTKAAKLLNRFLDKLEPQGDCLIYTGARLKTGYGIFHNGKKSQLAHRYAYESFHEVTLRPDEYLIHKCDVPACCSPNCISIGSAAMNSADMKAKGRSTKGVKKPVKRFTETEQNQIAAYLESGKTQYWIAKKMKRAESTISQVIKRIRYPKPRKPRTPKKPSPATSAATSRLRGAYESLGQMIERERKAA